MYIYIYIRVKLHGKAVRVHGPSRPRDGCRGTIIMSFIIIYTILIHASYIYIYAYIYIYV